MLYSQIHSLTTDICPKFLHKQKIKQTTSDFSKENEFFHV